jgi:glyceraldehyde 3-phosphate dehydrogenase
VEYGLITTIHSYTNDQKILDLPHKDLRRARAAAMSMIPTSTGAAKAIGLVMPHLKGKLDGIAVRVPTPDVSLTDLSVTLARDASKDAINAAFRKAASESPLKGYLVVLEDEVVSVDMTGSTASCLVDPFLTKVMTPRFVKVFGWYDNEFGYATRLTDLCQYVLARI